MNAKKLSIVLLAALVVLCLGAITVFANPTIDDLKAGGSFVLDGDFTTDQTLTITQKTTTIDLNGYTYTYNGTADGDWAIMNFNGTLTITNGNIVINDAAYGIYSYVAAKTYLTDVNIDANNVTDIVIGLQATYKGSTYYAKFDLTNVTITQDPVDGKRPTAVVVSDSCTATMTNCTITAPSVATVWENSTLTINGGTYKVNADDFVLATNGSKHNSTITVDGAVLGYEDGVDVSTLIYLPAQDSTTTITNTTINAPDTAIELRGGALNVDNCDITANENGHEVSSSANGNGSTTHGAAISVSQHSTNDDIQATVTNSTLTAQNDGAAVMQASTDGTEVEQVVMTVSDSTIEGGVQADDPAQVSVDASNDLTNATVDDAFYAAELNGTKYVSLEAAIAAAVDGDTVTLLRDSSGNGIKIPEGKFQPAGLTIEFGGYTYNVTGKLVGSTNTANQCFQLLKGNTITMQNGTITVDNDNVSWVDKNQNVRQGAAMIIQNYSNLTLDNMTIDGTGASVDYAVSNNNGATTIKDSTINSHDGGVAFDVWYGMSTTYPSVAVTVENSTINGDVEVGAAKGNAEQIANNMSLTISGNTTIEGDIVNSSSAAVAAVMEETTLPITVEPSVEVAGTNTFARTAAKTLLVYNMDMVDGKYQLAMFAGIDKLEVERCGFEVTQGDTTVYTTRWVSETIDVNGDVYEASQFGADAKYIFGQVITLDSDEEVTVRAFAINKDGSTVYSKSVSLADIYTLN